MLRGGLAVEVPDSLADLLLQAVRRLPDETQEMLRVASAGTGSTSHALLARVAGLVAAKRTCPACCALPSPATCWSRRPTATRSGTR